MRDDEATGQAGLQLTRRRALAGAALGLAVVPGAVSAQGHDGRATASSEVSPLVFCGAQMAVERAPVHIAMRNLYGDDAIVLNGSSYDLIRPDRRHLITNPQVNLGFDPSGKKPRADVASNGETQMMRASVLEPNFRVLMTVAEGRYPIIARRSAGITKLEDLRGKRILNFTSAPSSATFFLYSMLKSAGVAMSEVDIVHQPLGKIGDAVTEGMVDAVAYWEPDSEQALTAFRALGEDVVIFSGAGIYHERYNLCSTSDILANPDKRQQIVTLLREIIRVTDQINTNPVVRAEAQALVAKSGGLYGVEEITRGWPNVRFVAAFDDHMLDLFVAEETWLSSLEKRPPRSREQLAQFIDRSLHDEARS